MKNQFFKFIDSLNLSYKQLTIILAIILALIWPSIKFAIKANNFYEKNIELIDKTNKNTQDIDNIYKRLNNIQSNNNDNILYLYNDMITIKQRTDEQWNIKFNLLIENFNNKELLLKLLKLQDEQMKIFDYNKMKDFEFKLKNNNDTIIK